MFLATATFVPCLLAVSTTNHSRARRADWEFHIEYQGLLPVLNAIHQFGQSQRRSHSIVQISSTYAVHHDRRPSARERAKRHTRGTPFIFRSVRPDTRS
jgi:hypothetical protein